MDVLDKTPDEIKNELDRICKSNFIVPPKTCLIEPLASPLSRRKPLMKHIQTTFSLPIINLSEHNNEHESKLFAMVLDTYLDRHKIKPPMCLNSDAWTRRGYNRIRGMKEIIQTKHTPVPIDDSKSPTPWIAKNYMSIMAKIDEHISQESMDTLTPSVTASISRESPIVEATEIATCLFITRDRDTFKDVEDGQIEGAWLHWNNTVAQITRHGVDVEIAKLGSAINGFKRKRPLTETVSGFKTLALEKKKETAESAMLDECKDESIQDKKSLQNAIKGLLTFMADRIGIGTVYLFQPWLSTMIIDESLCEGYQISTRLIQDHFKTWMPRIPPSVIVQRVLGACPSDFQSFVNGVNIVARCTFMCYPVYS